MPAILTHDFFGRDAEELVSAQVNLISKDAHDAFMLGCQGPDPLFYLVVDPHIRTSCRVGDLMHAESPAKLLLALHDALSMCTRSELPVARAYAAGFVCHYLLDSAAHPLVFAQERAVCAAGVDGLDESDHSIVHAEIERDLDEMVLYTKLHETIATYRPYVNVLRASDATLSIIDKLYFYMSLWTYSRTLQMDTYTHAVRSFRLVQRAFWSPTGKLTNAIAVPDRLVRHTRYSLAKAMSHRVRAQESSPFANHEHRPWVHPGTGETSTESFWDLYEEALGQVFDALAAFFAQDFDREAALALTHGGQNFCGDPVPYDSEEARARVPSLDAQAPDESPISRGVDERAPSPDGEAPCESPSEDAKGIDPSGPQPSHARTAADE